MIKILLGWAINALCLLALPYLIPAVKISGLGSFAGFRTALLAALVLGLLNAIIRPILFILTLPITLLTLGLFTLVLNGLMFWLAARLIDGFEVTSFGWAMVAALAYSIVSWGVSSLLMRNKP
jgi:putative membrane protein